MLANEIIELKKQLIEYAGLIEQMIDKSITGLLKKDVDLLDEVMEKLEPRANDFEIELEQTCIILIAKFQPAAKDLRTIIMTAQMNNDLERVGDLAVNIAESALRLLTKPPVKPFIDIPNMAGLTIRMLKDAIDSFANENTRLAKSVCERDEAVDNLRDQIYRELITYMISNPSTIEAALEIMRISTSLERVADLSTNFCEDVIFIVEGRIIKHHKDEI
ncbi:MAG: phosphate signaling complex protein PhoU [Acidobacteriota bacterium]